MSKVRQALERGGVPALVLLVALGAAWVYRGQLAAWFGLDDETETKSNSDHAAGDGEPDEIAYYTCSMHPSVKSDAPGQCPICSMDLTPVTHGELSSGVLHVDSQRAQRIGVRYATAQRKELERSLVAVGEVNADENRLTEVALRTQGWVEKLHVEETGEYVERGQALLSLYSPDILTASEEVLAARRGTGSARDRLVAAAERKLLLLGVTRGQLKRLVSRGKARDWISVSSPATGYVVEKNVIEGAHIEQGTTILRIADLSQVWVDAQVYEADLPLVSLGQPVSVTLPFVPGEAFEGSIGYIHPRLDAKTRTARVRVVLDNPDLKLRPGMYADVEIDVDLGERLVIPREAVIYSGARRLVFVDLGEGRLQPKQVELGVRADGLVEVLDGVAEGERVVASGNFLIAAESRIRSATTIWGDAEEEIAPVKAPSSGAEHEHEHPYYTCPMHPEVHEHGPGQCPICKMDLEVRGGSAGASDPETSGDLVAPKPKPKPKSKPKPKPKPKPAGEGSKAPKVEVVEPPAEADSKQYTCPMHPQVVESTPGSCPICKMDLVEKATDGP